MTTDDGYAAWLHANPAPDLQELIRKHGGYDKITPEAWAEYDRVLAEWQEAKRSRHAGGDRTSNVPNENNVVTTQGTAVVADPEALCICGLPGVYWRPRKGGGRAIWRCEEHRDRWPDYAVEVYDAPPLTSRTASTLAMP